MSYFSSTYSQPSGTSDLSHFISNANICPYSLPRLNSWIEVTFDSTLLYKKTLQSIGYTKESEIVNILVYLFLEDFITRLPYIFDNKEDIEKKYISITEMLECIKRNSCIIQRLPDLCSYPALTGDRYLDGGYLEGIAEPCINVINTGQQGNEEENEEETPGQ